MPDDDGRLDEGSTPAWLEQRAAELDLATVGWTVPDFVRSYGVDDESQEDYEDDALLFGEHGYDHALERKRQQMTATYRKVGPDDLADTDPLEISLSGLSAKWTHLELSRSYSNDDEGWEELGDEAWIFEEHRYATTIRRRAGRIVATYRIRPVTDNDPPSTFTRTYESETQLKASELFDRDADDLAPGDGEDGYSPVNPTWTAPHPGSPLGSLTVTYLASPGTPRPPVLVWSYPGRNQVDAGEAFEAHALELAEDGYVPVAQSWAEGRPGLGRIFMLGLMANVRRPKGFLTVTYRLSVLASETTAQTTIDPLSQIERLGQLRDKGLISAQEFELKKADLLSRV
jgi:hypothetical protein